MSGYRSGASPKAMKIALSAVLTALSLIVLSLSCFVPTGKVGLVALAGSFPAAAVVSFGFSAGLLCYMGTGILALILLADKGMVLLYLLFFGLYPLLKGLIERMRILPLEWSLKLLFFNAVLFCLLTLFGTIFFSVIPLKACTTEWLCLICNVVFLVYDIGFSRLIGLYRRKVDRVLRKI